MTHTAEKIVVEHEDPRSFDARVLLDEFEATEALRFGRSSQASLIFAERSSERVALLVARTPFGEPLGCAGFRRFDFGVAELKCVYSRVRRAGVAEALLAHIEASARCAGYHTLMIETAFVDSQAITFFRRNGYGPALHYCFSYARENGPFLEKPLV